MTNGHPDGTSTGDEYADGEVLDLLIVGGGPAGTAAAFRARELGLKALVIDYDDVMKRIRDYAKDKQILPHFGGGDRMQFPQGDALVAKLHFGPIDKDDLCAEWKGLYAAHDIPSQTGVELTEIEREADGVWHVKTWNHRAKAEQGFRARHVALAIGRGVPRRFDIPGSTDGIAYKLGDPAPYLGHPACVIGGGTSAAEAVIALSEAKAAAGDDCAVYWSYRGDKLPKVSRALADVFFNAYLGNGNIRYYPGSEPVAVVTTPEKTEHLSIRVDRKTPEGRPSETVHLEFEKTRCVACIGEDIPEALLNALGISLATGGPSGKKRMVVTPLLETQQPNVYLIGDLLSQAYFETDDFGADPATFREIKHRGNIKSALRDGVFVAEVVRQKLDGREVIEVDLDFTDGPAEPSGAEPSGAEPSGAEPPTMARPQGRPEETVAHERTVEAGYLVRLTAGGVEENEFALTPHGITTIGRSGCTVSFPEDTTLSEAHASVLHGTDGVRLRDDGSTTGTFLHLRPGQPYPLADGDLLRLGQHFLRVHAERGGFAFTHYDRSGRAAQRYPLSEGTIVLGRQAPDLTLDAGDMVLSRRHVALSLKDGALSAKDLNSLNGTYLRVRDAAPLGHGDEFRVGQQLFRLSVQEEVTKSGSTTFRLTPFTPGPPAEPTHAPTPARAAPAPASSPPADVLPPTAPAEVAPAGAPSVTFKGAGEPIAVPLGRTLCDAAEAQGVELNAECHAGMCGSDPIRIVSGGEHLNEVDDGEADALEDICGLTPGNGAGQCRLACMVRLTGPVVVERV